MPWDSPSPRFQRPSAQRSRCALGRQLERPCSHARLSSRPARRPARPGTEGRRRARAAAYAATQSERRPSKHSRRSRRRRPGSPLQHARRVKHAVQRSSRAHEPPAIAHWASRPSRPPASGSITRTTSSPRQRFGVMNSPTTSRAGRRSSREAAVTMPTPSTALHPCEAACASLSPTVGADRFPAAPVERLSACSRPADGLRAGLNQGELIGY